MKYWWSGPGNLPIGDKLYPPGEVELDPAVVAGLDEERRNKLIDVAQMVTKVAVKIVSKAVLADIVSDVEAKIKLKRTKPKRKKGD